MSAESILSRHVLDTCDDVQMSLAFRPANLSHRMSFVAPAEPWKQHDEDRFCDFTVGLDVYLVAGAGDLVESYNWLDETTTLLLQAGPVDVVSDTIEATSVSAPFVFSDSSGASYLTARVTYSRLRSS